MAFEEYETLKGLDALKADSLRESGIQKAHAEYKRDVGELVYIYQNHSYIGNEDFDSAMFRVYRSHHRFLGGLQGALE